jgi:hypothetical protein
MLSLVSAEQQQCVRVQDSSGVIKNGLTCSFTDNIPIYASESMPQFVATGEYCITLNDTFEQGNEYTFAVTCTDGSVTSSVYGDVYIDKILIGGDGTGTASIIPQDQPLTFGSLDYWKQNPSYAIIGLFIVMGIAHLFSSNNKKRGVIKR